MSTTRASERFTTLPNERTLAETTVALEEARLQRRGRR